jgi:chromosome segregation ATPase
MLAFFQCLTLSGGMSGGERSYTTLALLMSLTNSIDSPFTCMDEFDVFMDEKNRRTSVSVMLKVAKELKKRQFLFITPNSIPVDDRDLVQNGGPVVIRKLVKPVRTEGGM